MLSAGAVSAPGAQLWDREPRAVGLAFKHQPKLRMELELTPPERELADVIGAASPSLYLFGGPVLARVEERATSWMNLLLDCRDFSRLKRKLFDFGVEPISTPEMPGSFIKFSFQDRIYNVMNCGIDHFCQLNRIQAKVQLVPFAHNFLIYDCNRRELADPCGALNARGNGKEREIRLVSRPRSVVEGFDCVLSARFESHLLGFQPSEELRDFDSFILRADCPTEDIPKIVERTINYIPDAIEILGERKAAPVALSPLVKQALHSGLRIEIENVWSGLKKEAAGDRPAAFIGLVKEEMGLGRGTVGFEDDLTLYLARNGYALRRSDLAAQAMMNA